MNRCDESGCFWNFVVGAAVGATISLTKGIFTIINNEGLTLKSVSKVAISTAFGALSGSLAAAGISAVAATVVGGVTGFAESMSHELIDNNGDLSKVNNTKIFTDTLVGTISGFAGGAGAIEGDKYMGHYLNSFINNFSKKGFNKSISYFYKMTSTYSYKFCNKTRNAIIKGFLAGSFANDVFKY